VSDTWNRSRRIVASTSVKIKVGASAVATRRLPMAVSPPVMRRCSQIEPMRSGRTTMVRPMPHNKASQFSAPEGTRMPM